VRQCKPHKKHPHSNSIAKLVPKFCYPLDSTGYILTLRAQPSTLFFVPPGGNRSYGLQDRRQSRLSEPRRGHRRADQLRHLERQNRTVLYDSHCFQRFTCNGSANERNLCRPALGDSLDRLRQSSRLPRKRQTQFPSRLEAPLQRKLRAHAHRSSSRSSRSPQEPRIAQHQQAPLLPRKENARARQVSSSQRNGHRPQHLRRKRRSHRRQVSGQSQTAIPGNDRDLRVALSFEGAQRAAPHFSKTWGIQAGD
jgi:hypothetical protein